MAKKKTLVVIPEMSSLWNVWCLDYAVKARLSGYDITILDLSDLNPIYFGNPKRRLARKISRRNRFDKIVEVISRENNITHLTSAIFKAESDNLPNIIGERSIRFWDAIDSKYAMRIGRRIRKEEDIDAQLLLIEEYFYNLTAKIIFKVCSGQSYDQVIVANGMQGVAGAVVATADALGIPLGVLELVSDARFAYQVHPSNLREDPKFLQDDIQRVWDAADNSKYEIAENVLSEKLIGKRAGTVSWSSSFLPINKPLDISNSKVAVMFPTSDFERPLSSHLDKNATFQGSQLVAFATFSEIAKRFGYSLIVRGHPHPISPIKRQMEDDIWQPFCEEHSIHYISSGSHVNSYDLMMKSSLNVSYLSSCTLDSIILGGNTLTLARRDFTNLVPEICAFTPNEIEEKLRDPHLKIERSRIYPWAFHYKTAGEEVTLFNISDESGAVFYKGKKVDAVRFGLFVNTRIANRVRSWLSPYEDLWPRKSSPKWKANVG
jgi:hypothetical protein